jgi:hypothetical protein
MTGGRIPALGPADLAVLASVGVAGAVNLPVPFGTDAAFFATGARELLAGEALYRDFWDLKQPGIFWFYLAAGWLAGFDEIGIHAVELACMIGLAAVLLVTLRGPAGSPGVARLAALLTVGVYYATVGSHQLTQIEGLVALPLFLCLWWAVRSADRPRGPVWPLVLSGIAGGVALLLKLVFLPILLGLWLTALWGAAPHRPRPAMAAVARRAVAIGSGLALPLGAAAAVLSAQGVLDSALWTFFVYPARVAAATKGVGEPGHLVAGLTWFAERFGPILALALVGAYARLSATPEAPPLSRLLVRGLLAWTVTAALVIALQRSWWPYHFLLLLLPLGVLAAMGVDAIWRRLTAAGAPRPMGWVAGGALVLVFLELVAALGLKLVLLRHAAPWAPRDRRLHYLERFNREYPAILGETAFLREPGSLPGAIYVFGDPLHYHLAGRGQAAAIPGLWFERYDAAMWDELARQLARRLPAYILVTSHEWARYDRYIAERAPGLVKLLADSYRLHHRTSTGIWYERTAAVSGAAPRADDPGPLAGS